MKINEIPLPIQIRLRTIEVLLNNYGFASRKVLCDLFSITDATVSRDIGTYNKLNPNGCYYNRKNKRNEKLSDFKRIFT